MWFRLRGALLAAAVILAAGCTDRGSPEYVADQFVEAYFRRMDQAGARAFTALGATKMLESELALTESIRKDGYSAEQAAASVAVHRGESARRDERVRVPYTITVKGSSGDMVRQADVELSKIQGEWKVVRLGLSP